MSGLEPDCIHEIPRNTCSHCSGRDGGETAERLRKRALIDLPHVIEAKYAGRCALCGEHYGVGEPITANRPEGWIASCCLDDSGGVKRR